MTTVERLTAAARGVISVVRHPLARNFSFLASGNLVSRALLFVVNVQLARVLSPAAFGKVVLAQTLLLFATVAADLGTRTITIRDVAAAESGARFRVAGLAWGAILALTVPATVLLLGSATLFADQTQRWLTVLFALTLPAYGLNLDWYLKGSSRFGHVGVAEVIKALVYLSLVLVWLKGVDDVLLVPVAYALAWWVAAAYLFFAVRQARRLPRIHLEGTALRRLVAAGLPIGITGVLTQLYLNGGILFLGKFADAAAIGLYGAAFKLTLIVTLMGALFSETLLPTLSRRYTVSNIEGRRLVRLALVAVSSAGLLAAAIFVVFGREILMLLYGPEYEGAVPILTVLAIAMVPLFCNIPFVNVLIVKGRQRYLLVAAIVGCSVNVIANLTLTPDYGPLGAAVAELLTETGVFVTLALFAIAKW